MVSKKKLVIKRIITAIIVLGIIAYIGYWKLSSMKSDTPDAKNVTMEMAHNPDLAIDDELINEKYEGIPSDIEGMTKYDKVQMGLDPEDGSDSDYDGLTDKEEIEVYGSDPLKTSTSGDLYCDGYKVSNGLDINTFYEDGEVIYVGLPDGLRLHARYASDNTATIGTIPYKNEGAYYGFLLSRFAGSGFSYDISAICNEHDIEGKDIGVYIKDYTTDEYVDCDYKVTDNILDVECDFTKPNGYTVYILKKSAIPSKFTRFLFGDEIAEEFKRLSNANEFDYYKGYYKDAAEGLVVMPVPILAALGADLSICRPLLYYNETEDSYQNGSVVDQLAIIAHETLNNDSIQVKLKPTTIVRIVNLYNKLEAIGDGFFNGKHDSFWHNAFFDYILLSEYNNSLPPENKLQNYEGQANFDIVADTLPFANFKTSIGTSGNCMGISTLITKIHNTGTNPSSGASESASNLIWDLSGDEENTTLTDPVLNDYKDVEFAEKHKDLTGRVSVDLTDGEKAFLMMVGAYFVDGNMNVQRTCPKINPEGYTMYSLYKLRQACKNNLNDKVLTLGMFNGKSGHAVNVYGYVDELDTGGEFYLKVYDNNFPGDESKGLRVVITPNEKGTFDYKYTVPGVKDYGYSSEADSFMFVLLDENYNVVYGSEDDIQHLPEPVGVKSKKDEILEQMNY